jgi:carbamate kinase
MLIVVGLGGNALLRRGEMPTPEGQRASVRRAAEALGPLIRDGHRLVITHGNGPQIGLLALASASEVPPNPLDVLGAETEGMIGYVIEQELGNVLPAGRLFATLLTQTQVDARDEAFRSPTKPIGPVYDEATALGLAKTRSWSIGRDGKGWRRVVASPRPQEILEVRVIELLVNEGVTVICTGGGGIPVVRIETGAYVGVEAVVDKDLASALLARQLRADLLMLLTDVEAVYADWASPGQRAIAEARPGDLDPSRFAAGSMRPKVQAAIEFVNETGHAAAIGALEKAGEILRGKSGTRITLR